MKTTKLPRFHGGFGPARFSESPFSGLVLRQRCAGCLGRGGPTTDRDILVKARLCGQLNSYGTVHWKANGPLAAPLAKAAFEAAAG
jgi:hypothetical protein